MSKFIVLLRGINVGGNNILPMKALITLLEGIGCSNIKTYIQSGNVVLESSSRTEVLSKCIESEIEKTRGFKVSILVLTLVDFELAVSGVPFDTEDGKSLHLFFLSDIPSKPEISVLENCKSATEKYELNGRVLYLYAPDGIGRSKFVPKVEKSMGVSATARNWNTVQKLVKLAGL